MESDWVFLEDEMLWILHFRFPPFWIIIVDPETIDPEFLFLVLVIGRNSCEKPITPCKPAIDIGIAV